VSEKAELLAALVDVAFPRARAAWSPFLLLGRPVIEGEGEKLAHIDLKTRTIRLGAAGIARHGLEDALTALLAHEIGHLVAAPGSLAAAARLRLLERTFLPKRLPSLTPAFYELIVDERLPAGLMQDRARVLRAEAADGSLRDPLFCFQLAVLEELWQLPPGELMGEAFSVFQSDASGYRTDAQLVAHNMFALGPSIPLQFLYFASIAFPYAAAAPSSGEQSAETVCVEGELSAEDWAEALKALPDEKAAVRRAIVEGWFPADIGEKLEDQDTERRMKALPGRGDGDPRLLQEVMAAHYRREAERWLFSPPPATIRAEELVPTTLEEWDPGEPVASIDWVATLLQRGERLGAAMPLLRERIADEEGQQVRAFEGRTEIYLDTSGSMPDPTQALNAMTLAAQILALGTVRAGGSARALIYSTGYEKCWTFLRSEAKLSRFLLHYIGQGTDFPFEVLAASVEECRAAQPVRIIITDRDFDHNYDGAPANAKTLASAAERSPALVLLLHDPLPERVRRYEAKGARVVPVRRLHDFPRLAAALSFALFERGSLPAAREEEQESTSW
jgi:hypothetical protein